MHGRREYAILIVVAVGLALLAFSNAGGGEFVYDDEYQIVQNRYIQEDAFFFRGLVTDVWAFKGERDRAWSNYWRPVFVLWLNLNFRLFGLEPAGWHWTNLALHIGVIVLAGLVLQRLRLPWPAALAALAWFAVHPSRVESVTWISGSPDLLLGTFLLSSYLAFLGERRVTALLLFVPALLCKEPSVVFPAILFFTVWRPGETKRSLTTIAPYVGLAALFLFARSFVIQSVDGATPWAPPWMEVFVSLPRIFLFYLGQAAWPFTLSPAYPIRVSGPGALSAGGWLATVAGLALGFAAVYFLVRGDRLTRIALAFVLFPLAPAMNVRAFLPEQIVHDRYLYLPLLGLSFLVARGLYELALRFRGESQARLLLATVGCATALALIPTTRDYNRVWSANVALWERAVEVDPNSSHTCGQLAYYYRKAGRIDEARALLEKALEIVPGMTQAHVDLGILALGEGRLAEAEKRFRFVVDALPEHEVAIDQLVATYSAQKRPEDAIELLKEAARRLPYNRGRYAVNMAVLYRGMGRDDAALAALESILPELEGGPATSELLRAHFFLGELYSEAGRTEEARRQYRRYLERTAALPADQAPYRRLIEERLR